MITKRLLARLTLPLILMVLTQTVLAQKVISGKVTDSKDGSPIVGATIQPKGGASGTSTGTDGTFRLTVDNSVTTLTVSYVGFGTVEMDIAGKSTVDVSLSASANNNLNEVVVVGYGTTRKKDITGSVVSVKEKDFNRGVITAPDQLIQGKVAGVQMLNNSGQPGGATTVRIRGNASVRSGNSPLYVVDGVPLDNNSARGRAGTNGIGNTPGANPINFINPNDIATMDVLKDASATAIYGSRGSNGVVIITTKRGLTGAPQINYNGSVGMSRILRTLEVLDAAGYRDALKQYGNTTGDYGGNVDAMDAITRTAFTQNHNMSLAAGTENARYRVSVGYLNQDGIIRESAFRKYTANLTSNFKFLESKRLALDINVLTSHNIENIAPVTNDAGFQGNVISQALQWNPTHPLRLPNDSIWVNNQIGSTTVNPLAMLEAYDDISNLTNVLASISPSYKFTNELEYKLLYSVRYATGNRQQEMKRWINLDGIRDRGFAAIGNNQLTTQQVTNTLSYNKTFTGSDINVNAVVGHEYMKFQNAGRFMFGLDFVDNGINYVDFMQYSTTSSRVIETFNDPVSELQSYFGRVVLGYKGKYSLTATMRADGSSKFGENNKYGYFPSVGFAWNVTSEEFLANNNAISNLKLRASWGKTGNQEFPAGASLTRYRFTGPGAAERTNFGNKDLKWESSTTVNVGIDFGIINDRVFGSVDYFNKKTSDVLFEQFIAQPGPTGNAKYWVNLPGEVVNKGVEVALTGVIVRNKDLNWNLGVVASFLKNELTNFGSQIIETGGLHGQGISGTTIQRLVNNQPLNVFYLRQFEGIDKTTGLSVYTDGGNTRYYAGSPNPDLILGINTDVSYKRWTASINMNGAYGHYVYNNTANTVLPIGNLGTRNIASTLLGTGTKESAANAVAASTRFLEKGDYLKLANATITYNLGNIGRTFRGVSLSLTGQNLFIITDFSGFDPEVNTDKSVGGVPSFGIEYTAYPSARTILLGLNFSL
jgi:TonB-dependent starch-binding outer membrane protein SusC